MTVARKKARAKTSTQKLEAGVASVGRALNALVKLVEREGGSLKPQDVHKAFSFVALTATAGQQKALASVQAAGLTKFSLSAELPTLPQTSPFPTLATATAAPAPVAPSGPRGPSVNDLGGRFVSEARGRPKPATETDPDAEVGFLDEDEDTTPNEDEED